jgi:hypothetical protein
MRWRPAIAKALHEKDPTSSSTSSAISRKTRPKAYLQARRLADLTSGLYHGRADLRAEQDFGLSGDFASRRQLIAFVRLSRSEA